MIKSKIIKALTFSSALLFSSFTMAELSDAPIDKRDNQAIARQVINAPANKVWKEIGRVDGIENFVPEVFASTSVEGEGEGAIRTCVHHDGRKLVEQVVAFDEVSMTLTYTLVDGSELPMINMYNTVQVHPINETQSLLVWEAKYDVTEEAENPELVHQYMQGGLSVVSAGAKRYIEAAM
ncbi:SRPBCC family protein [Agaribacterium sp. ZY112]|uniref:SRPBCC family protein n=1 Tax=Agaribacterium sp. ZY112 TaxID=3233574 RepID=UPI003524BF32